MNALAKDNSGSPPPGQRSGGVHRRALRFWATASALAASVATPAHAASLAPAAWTHGIVAAVAVVLLLDVAALGVIVVWIRGRERRRLAQNLASLHRSLDEVDIFGQGRPQIQYEGDAEHALLANRINALLDRVHQYKQKLTARDRRLRRVLGNVNDILYQTNAAGEVLWITDSVERVLGYRAEEVRGCRFDDFLVSPEHRPEPDPGHEVTQYSVRAYRRDGTIAWLLLTVRHLTDANGRPVGTEAVCRDGTDLIQAEEALFRERKRAQITLASIGDGVITTDTDGRVDYINPAAEALTGADRDASAGHSLDEVCRLTDARTGNAITGLALTCMDTGEQIKLQRDVTLRRGAGQQESVVEVSVAPIRDSRQALTGTVIVLHDLTQISEMSERMYHQATHDALTGLPNRQVFETRLETLLDEARREGRHHALCYLDLDQFKLVNDTCGHAAGDELLRQIANRLETRLTDRGTLARLGGDEFGVLLEDCPPARSQAVAETLRTCVEDFRFAWDNKLFRVSASIGLVDIGTDSPGAADLLSSADAACYIAKDGGRNRIHVYSTGKQEIFQRHDDMERVRRIRQALDSASFELHGQIIRAVNWTPGQQVCVELLARMCDGEDLLAPQDFLPIAERFQIMPEIDRWVLDEALALVASGGAGFERIDYFSINLSGQSMGDGRFLDFAAQRIRDSGVDPRRLVFEITETTAVANLARAGELMERLRQMGCRFALDDFGSGLSSFSYLKQLPLDFLKIDGTFVRDMCSDPVDLETVKSINQVGHAMGLATIAEYVENRDILEALRRIGVDYVQGFYLGQPLPLDRLLKSRPFTAPARASRG